MNIEDFLKILEENGLVPQAIIAQVRTKVQKGDRRITSKSLLKYLVKQEHLTRHQARQLLETTLTVSPRAESSILGMLPMPTEASQQERPSTVHPPSEEIPTIAPVDEKAAANSAEGSDVGAGILVTDEGSFVNADLFGEKPESLLAESLSRIGVSHDPALDSAIEEGKISAGDPSDPQGKRARKKQRNKKKSDKNEWDSSLLLLGGGGLVLLLIAGVIIAYLLSREDADAILAEANSFFEGTSYTQSIKQYQRFVENHPQHPDYSAGKVRLGLARLWKATSGSPNFTEALEVAQQVLPEIEDEDEFSSAQQDLASLLPQIAQGLANQAEKTSALHQVQTLVKQANVALSFCTNTKYIPKGFRDEVALEEISQTLERVQRTRAQNAALSLALTDMQTAIDRPDLAAAYLLHDQLLEEHPGLIDNGPLRSKILEISMAESAVVRYIISDGIPTNSPPETTQVRPSQVVAELALADRSGPAAQGAEGSIGVRISGAVYGLNLSDGALRWRRFVGVAPRLTPLRLPSGDLLVVDAQHHELLKLAGMTGKLLWRQSFATSVTRPVLLGQQILVAESAGKLHVLDTASGKRHGYVQFAQALPTPPVVGTQGRCIYITGEHSSLYTLSAEDFSCLGVFFLNHAKGSVATPPVCVLDKVIVAVAKGLSTCHLEVINTTDVGIAEQRATSRRLSGLVNTKLLTQGRRLVALTSRGQVAVYEVGSGAEQGALTQIALREPESASLMARFGFFSKGHVWVAGPNLNKLTLLPTSDRLSVSTLDRDYQGDTFDHPLQARDGLLIHVRRSDNRAGVIVAAMQMATGQPQWETELAAPPAGPPAADVEGMQIGTITASGSAYLVDRQSMRSRVVNFSEKVGFAEKIGHAEQVQSRRKLPPLSQSLDLGLGRLVASARQGQVLLHFRPGLPRDALQAIPLAGRVSCPPVVWEEGFVVPTETGQVFLFSSDMGESWGSPFQPPLVPGVSYHWLSPAVYGSGEEAQLVLSDGNSKVYLLNRVASPQPHLAATATADISTSPLNTRFAVVGDVAVAGTSQGSLAVFQLPTLASKPAAAIEAPITWGPFTVGQHVVLATATEEMICLDDQAKILWRQTFARGRPTGQPIARKDGLLLVWQQGGISRIQLSGGEETAYVPLPQPVVAGPVPFGERLIVSAYDGTLLIIASP